MRQRNSKDTLVPGKIRAVSAIISTILVVMLVVLIIPRPIHTNAMSTSQVQIQGTNSPEYYAYNTSAGRFDSTVTTSSLVSNNAANGAPDVEVKKTIKGTENEDVFEINLEVSTTQEIEKKVTSPKVAATLVFDCSASMNSDIDGNRSSLKTRLELAKEAATEFLYSYAGFEKNAGGDWEQSRTVTQKRLVSIVSFADRASIKQSWYDLSAADTATARKKVQTVLNVINALTAFGGTNLEAGFKETEALWASSDVSGITERYTVLLADGEPNNSSAPDETIPGYGYPAGYAPNGYSKPFNTAAQRANQIRTVYSSALYSIAIGQNAGQSWLTSISDQNFSAVSSSGLLKAFEDVLNFITLASEAWIVKAPAGECISILGVDTSAAPGADWSSIYSVNDGVLSWNLKNDYFNRKYFNSSGSEISQNDLVAGETYTTSFSLTYTIKLDPFAKGFAVGQYFLTSGRTTLDYFLTKTNEKGYETYIDNSGTQISEGSPLLTLDFKVPAVKGFVGEMEFRKIAHNTGEGLGGVEFTLESTERDASGNPVYSDTVVSGENGRVTFSSIPSRYSYILREIRTVSGYLLDTKAYNVKVSYGEVTVDFAEGDSFDGSNWTSFLASGNTRVNVTKIWKGPQGSGASSQVSLYGDDKNTPVQVLVLNEDNGWTASTDLLPYINVSSGTVINYSVEEVVADGYISEITSFEFNEETGEYNAVITNTAQPVDLRITKKWVGYRNDVKSVSVEIYGNGAKAAEAELTSENGWTSTVSDLPYVDDNGNIITYTVSEAPIFGYTSSYSELVFENREYSAVITSTADPVTISVTKDWKGYKEDIDIAVVDIFGENGVLAATLELTEENSWTSVTGQLPYVNPETGEVINYTAVERDVVGYESVVGEMSFDNESLQYSIVVTSTAEATRISVTKDWIGYKDDITAISADIKNGDEVVMTLNINASEGWSATTPKLAFVDEQGNIINYTIEETPVYGYSSKVSGLTFDAAANQYTGTITNTASAVSVKVVKNWIGYKNDVEAIAVNIKNGEEVAATLELTAENSWTATAEELAYVDENGNVIEYTIEESETAGYTSEVSMLVFDAAANQYTGTITNTAALVTVDVTGVWMGYKNDVTELLVDVMNGDIVAATLELTEENSWSASTAALPYVDGEGNVIEYSVLEKNIAGYTSAAGEIVYDNELLRYSVSITNTPDPVKVKVVKNWVAYKNDVRAVEIDVMANGAVVSTHELTAKNSWSATTEDLPYADEYGNTIVYTVAEKAVAGYTSTYSTVEFDNDLSQYTAYVTNTANPVTINVSGVWAGFKNDVDSVEIAVLNGSDVVDTLRLTEDTLWSATTKELPYFDDNENAIAYTISASSVDGYTSSVGELVFNSASSQYSVTITNTVIIVPEPTEPQTVPANPPTAPATGAVQIIRITTEAIVTTEATITAEPTEPETQKSETTEAISTAETTEMPSESTEQITEPLSTSAMGVVQQMPDLLKTGIFVVGSGVAIGMVRFRVKRRGGLF